MKQKVEQFQKLLELLPPPNRCLLSSMIVHMTHIIAKVTIVIVNMTQVTSVIVNIIKFLSHYLCVMMEKEITIILNCGLSFRHIAFVCAQRIGSVSFFTYACMNSYYCLLTCKW